MKMTLVQHLIELRNRMLWSLLFFVCAIIVGFYFIQDIESFAMAPLFKVWDNPALIYTGLTDGLAMQFSLSGLFALMVSVPFFLWQLWKYAAPALKSHERKFAAIVVFLSPILFGLGVAFAYYILLPLMIQFFISVGADSASYMPSVKSYLALSIGIMKSFGIAFQFPLVLVILNRAGLFSRRQIFAVSRYVIIAIFVFAAALTPPDVVSQIALAVPLLCLFAASFLFMI